MRHDFDADYWQAHWRKSGAAGDGHQLPANPSIGSELGDLAPGTALDAGCGEGAEAVELASRGWRVTGADISAEALERARAAAERANADVTWVEADLARWEPPAAFDLVTTFYAHPDIPQLDFYARIAEWVAPGGTLLIVGHLHDGGGHASAHAHADDHAAEHAHGDGHPAEHAHADGHPAAHAEHAHGDDHPAEPSSAHAHEPTVPVEATVTAADVVAILDPARWIVATAEERRREARSRDGRSRMLQDVVVRATRR